jgi:hypothetical protein
VRACTFVSRTPLPVCVCALLAVDCKVSPVDQMGKFYCDSLVHNPDALRLVVKVFGPCCAVG